MTSLARFDQLTSALTSPELRAIAQHWDEARGDKRMPGWGDLSSAALAPHFAKLWGFKYDTEKGDFIGQLAGKQVRDWLGANFWGASLKDIHHSHGTFKDAFNFLFNTIATPSAGRCKGRLFTMGDQTILGERISLPLAADGEHADGVLGASDYEVPQLVVGSVKLIHEQIEWYAI